jgi:glyoxylase-like metal-dependent hydrolase (beta-lactamase superfamily II)
VVDVIVDDDDFELPLSQFLPGSRLSLLEQHRNLLEPDFVDLDNDVVKFAIQTFVVRVNGRTILIDTCIGEQKDRPEIPVWHQRKETGFLERLAKIGVDARNVDVVFCTHLHVDHVGWNTRQANGRWEPTFPNARYLIGRSELDSWTEQRNAGTAPTLHASALQDSVLPIVDAGLADLVENGQELGSGLSLINLPGHTPGQMGLRVDYPNRRAIFCGDVLHSQSRSWIPVFQLYPVRSQPLPTPPGVLF